MDNTNQKLNNNEQTLGFRTRGFSTNYTKPRSTGKFDVYRTQSSSRSAPKLPPRQVAHGVFMQSAPVAPTPRVASVVAPKPSAPSVAPDAFRVKVRSLPPRQQVAVVEKTVASELRQQEEVVEVLQVLKHTEEKTNSHVSVLSRLIHLPGQKIRQFSSQPKMAQVVMFMALIVFSFGMYVSIVGFNKNVQLEAQVEALQPSADAQDNFQASASSPEFIPSEDVPSDQLWQNYIVPSDMPRFLKIPSINSQGIVRKLGVDENGVMMVPKNIFEIGWYEESAKPNDKKHGAILMAAHVEGPTMDGVFYNLKNVAIGDTVELEDGAGNWYTYKVVDKRTYVKDAVDMRAALTPITEGKQGLNLITCTGTFVPGEHTYDQRLVVFTERVN